SSQFDLSLKNLNEAIELAKRERQEIAPNTPTPTTPTPHTPTTPGHEAPNAELEALVLRKIAVLLEKQNFEEARKVCDEALGGGMQKAKVYSYRGASYLGMNKFAMAEKDCEVAHNLDPNSTEALFWLASAKRGGRDWPGVIRCCTKLLKLNPASIPAWSLRCDAKRQLGRWRGVLQDTNYMVKLSEGRQSGAVWCARAEALMHLGKTKAAEKASSNGIKCDGELAMLYQIRGESRYQQKKFKLSVADFHRYGQLDRIRRGAPFTSHAYAIWQSNRDRLW
ncbi:hypothetical protein TrRE_jg1312, partial [Triparma retinervis]